MSEHNIKITITLSDEELRVLREVDLYCRDSGGIKRSMPIRKLFDQYKVSGGTINRLISEEVVRTRSVDYPYQPSIAGDQLADFEVRPTSIGVSVVSAAKKIK